MASSTPSNGGNGGKPTPAPTRGGRAAKPAAKPTTTRAAKPAAKPAPATRTRRPTDEREALARRAHRLRSDGQSFTAIATEFGLPLSTTRRLYKLGVRLATDQPARKPRNGNGK